MSVAKRMITGLVLNIYLAAIYIDIYYPPEFKTSEPID